MLSSFPLHLTDSEKKSNQTKTKQKKTNQNAKGNDKVLLGSVFIQLVVRWMHSLFLSLRAMKWAGLPYGKA